MKKEHSKTSFLRTLRYESVKQWQDSSNALELGLVFLFVLGFLFALAYLFARNSFLTASVYLDELEAKNLEAILQGLDPNSQAAALDRFFLSRYRNASAYYGLAEEILFPTKSTNLGASFAFSYLFFLLPSSLLFALYPLYQVFLRDNVSGFARNWGEGERTLLEIRKGKRAYCFLFLLAAESLLFLMGLALIPGGECAYYDGTNYLTVATSKVYLLSMLEMFVCSLLPLLFVSFLFNERESKKSFFFKSLLVIFWMVLELVIARVPVSFPAIPYLGVKSTYEPSAYQKRILIEGLVDAGALLVGIGWFFLAKSKPGTSKQSED
jgi:hypothetical protein